MKTSIVTLLITFCFYLSVYAQAPQDKATELKEQALSSLKQKDYIKARYLFKKAYEAFAARENYPQAIMRYSSQCLICQRELLQRRLRTMP